MDTIDKLNAQVGGEDAVGLDITIEELKALVLNGQNWATSSANKQ